MASPIYSYNLPTPPGIQVNFSIRKCPEAGRVSQARGLLEALETGASGGGLAPKQEETQGSSHTLSSFHPGI